jgi:hypothetical protein
MAVTYPNEQGGLATPLRLIDQGAKQEIIVVRRTFNLTAQTTSDTLAMRLPAGLRPIALRLDPSVTLGSSTLSFGPSGTLAKYRAAATLTAPSLSALPLAASAKLATPEDIIGTIAAATLPGSGTLVVEFWCTKD